MASSDDGGCPGWKSDDEESSEDEVAPQAARSAQPAANPHGAASGSTGAHPFPTMQQMLAAMLSMSGMIPAASQHAINQIISGATAALPPEPPEGARGACKVVIKLPDGDRLARSFWPRDSADALFHFVLAASPQTAIDQVRKGLTFQLSRGGALPPLELGSGLTIESAGVAGALLSLLWNEEEEEEEEEEEDDEGEEVDDDKGSSPPSLRSDEDSDEDSGMPRRGPPRPSSRHPGTASRRGAAAAAGDPGMRKGFLGRPQPAGSAATSSAAAAISEEARSKAAASKAAGKIAFAAGKYRDAMELFSEAIRADPTDHVLLSNRSACFASLSLFDKAAEDAQSCVRLAPDWPKGYQRLGLALFRQGEFAASVGAYSKAVKMEASQEAQTSLVAVRPLPRAKPRAAACGACAPGSARSMTRKSFTQALDDIVSHLDKVSDVGRDLSRELMASSCIAAVVTTMAEHKDLPAVQRSALGVLHGFLCVTSSESLRRMRVAMVHANGGLRAVLDAVKDTSNGSSMSPETLRNGLAILRTLVSSAAGSSAAGTAALLQEVIDAVVDVLVLYAADSIVQEVGTSLVLDILQLLPDLITATTTRVKRASSTSRGGGETTSTGIKSLLAHFDQNAAQAQQAAAAAAEAAAAALLAEEAAVAAKKEAARRKKERKKANAQQRRAATDGSGAGGASGSAPRAHSSSPEPPSEDPPAPEPPLPEAAAPTPASAPAPASAPVPAPVPTPAPAPVPTPAPARAPPAAPAPPAAETPVAAAASGSQRSAAPQTAASRKQPQTQPTPALPPAAQTRPPASAYGGHAATTQRLPEPGQGSGRPPSSPLDNIPDFLRPNPSFLATAAAAPAQSQQLQFGSFPGSNGSSTQPYSPALASEIAMLRSELARAQAENARLRAESEGLQQRMASHDKAKLCTICAEGPLSHACVPCGHKCICKGCKAKPRGLCPICRQKVTSIIEIFDTGFQDDDDF